jgi:hypothetical protein
MKDFCDVCTYCPDCGSSICSDCERWCSCFNMKEHESVCEVCGSQICSGCEMCYLFCICDEIKELE